MVQAHTGSTLGLSGDFILPVDFQDIYFPFYWNEVSGRGHEPSLNVSTFVPDDKFGQVLAVEDGTTNILGSSAQQASGWEAQNGISITDLGEYIEARVTNTTALMASSWGGQVRINLNPSTVNGQIGTFSIEEMIIQNLNGGQVRLFVEDNQTSNWASSSVLYTKDGRYINQFIARQYRTDITSAQVALRFSNTSPLNARVLFKKAQFELKPWATSFTINNRNNGMTSYPKELLNTSAFTINAWVKLNCYSENTNAYQVVAEICSSTHQNNRLLFMFERHSIGHGIRLFFGNDTQNSGVSAIPIRPPLNEWVMVTVTYDGTTYRLYYNGVFGREGIGQPVSFHSNATLNIGGRHWGRLNGQISGFLIRPYATRPDEIKAWYDYGKQLYDPYDYSATWG